MLASTVATGLLLGSAPASAHHSQAMFDMSKCLTLSGTVRTFQYQFPHSWLWVVVHKGDGIEEVWGLESAGPAQMIEVNPKWSRTVVQKGDKISLTYSPMKDGRNAGALATLTLPDGTVLRAATPAARAAEAQANMSTCLPAGPTAIMSHGVLTEFLFTPGRVTILFEDGEIRRIRTDGSAHRDLEELSESFMGDSIGHWEGQTLVVETIGFPKGEIFQNHGVRATRNTHLEERFHLTADGRLQVDTTMTDPVIFVAPYRFTRIYKRSTLPMYEPVCAQNNRDTGTTMDLTPPPEE